MTDVYKYTRPRIRRTTKTGRVTTPDPWKTEGLKLRTDFRSDFYREFIRDLKANRPTERRNQEKAQTLITGNKLASIGKLMENYKQRQTTKTRMESQQLINRQTKSWMNRK